MNAENQFNLNASYKLHSESLSDYYHYRTVWPDRGFCSTLLSS